MYRKVSFIALVLVVMISVLAGCAGSKQGSEGSGSPSASATPTVSSSPPPSESAAPEPIELEFWTINLKKNFEAYITGMISAYESANPGIKIKWVDVPGAEVTRKLITALSSDEVPDLVNETTLGLSQLQGYGAVTPISDLVDASKLDPYIDGLITGVTRQGKVMALPWYNSGPHVSFINTELYTKAGLDPNKPAMNFDELFAYGKQIHQKLPKVYGSNDLPALTVLQQEGLPIVSEDRKKALFNSPEHVAFINKFVQAYKDGAIAPGAVARDDRQLQQNLENEMTAHAGVSVATIINSWEKNTPNLLPKMKVVPPVMGKAGLLPIKSFQTFIIPKKSKHPKEAADFGLFITSHENQLAFCKLVAIFPSTEATLKDSFFTATGGTALKDKTREIQVANATKMSLSSFGFDKEEDMFNYYNEAIRAIMLGEKPVQEALDDAVKFWDDALAKQP